MTENATATFLRPMWRRLFPQNWQFGVFLLFVWTTVRFVLVLHANQAGSYQWVSLIFLSMWIAPFLFLTGSGRKQMGWTRPGHFGSLLLGALGGAVICCAMYFFAFYLFGFSFENWFVYISRSYPASGLTADNRLTYFLIYALIGMTFSPIGEELFYRGMVHETFAVKLGNYRASVIDSTAFALVHLAHFGIVYVEGGWRFLVAPALLWVALLYFTSRFFFLARQRSGSILGAIAAHAGFNVMMMYLIFYFVLGR